MAVSLLLAALAALAIVGINEAGYRQSTRALADIDEAQKGRGVVNQILQNMLDAETGQRGYLLTGEASYRQPYDTAIKQVDGHLATLRQLYADRPAERAQLAELSKHVLRKVAEMDMSVRLRQDGKEDAWKFVITTDVGREEMDAIRATAGELVKVSNKTLLESQVQVLRSLQLARIGTAIVALAALMAFFLYLRQTHALRSIGERQQEALQRERNALEDEVRERTASLAELATHLQDVRETERGYLARELHDELGSASSRG
jgi:CHASE3 domain sensor protein